MIHDSNSLGDDRIDLVVVSVNNLCAAQSLIAGCEACSEEAEIPFDWILDRGPGGDIHDGQFWINRRPVEATRVFAGGEH